MKIPLCVCVIFEDMLNVNFVYFFRLSPPLVVDLPPSLADSGHFEDLANGKDWSHSPHTSPRPRTSSNSDLELLRRHYEDIIRDLKEKHNDKVDSLLQRITKANDRYTKCCVCVRMCVCARTLT